MSLKNDENDELKEEGADVRRRVGGRSARVRESVLRATWDILLEHGIEGMTFSEIGRRADVHETSVQRRWGSKENLIFETLVIYGTGTLSVPDSGSLRQDLISFIKTLAGFYASPIGKSILQLLVANAGHDQAFAERRAEFVQIRVVAVQTMVRRAAERGELREGIDHELVLDLALGPLYVRALITRRPVDDSFIEHSVDTLLQGLIR